MLHLNTIDETMHGVLLSLLGKNYMNDFSLVGGTSLSLRFGHRKSIVYFEEADDTEEPEILVKNLKWEQVKNTSFINL